MTLPTSTRRGCLVLAAALAGCIPDAATVPTADAQRAIATQIDALHGRSCDRDADSSADRRDPACARSRFAPVLGSYMHYLEAGDRNGPPIVLLHGQPTWSYLYRNIIPRLPASAHIIAPDAIGYGFSGSPEIAYSWQDHVDYMDAFITGLGLKDVILVVHDFGSFQGLAYAARHPENVRGIVMMESIAAPFPDIDQLVRQFPPGTPGAKFAGFLRDVRSDRAVAERLIVDDNVFIEQFLPGLIARSLTPAELNAYRAPFRTRASREKLVTIPLGIPMGGQPAENFTLVANYARYLTTSQVPKLILYADRGLIFPPPAANALAGALPNARAESIGDGLHFIQEDHPVEIAAAISRFYADVTGR
jgi:haloalkane dehalogenase